MGSVMLLGSYVFVAKFVLPLAVLAVVGITLFIINIWKG